MNKTTKRLTASIISLIIMAVCLATTTFAIVYSMVSVESNLFTTGVVQIDLNGGKAVISKGECLLEPGATFKRDFYIENQSTCEVYYKLYFKNVGGMLANVVEIKICDGDKVLYQGTPDKLTRENVGAAAQSLAIGERKNLQMYFYFPTTAGNSAQGQELFFDFAADAVQTKNNPNKLFD